MDTPIIVAFIGILGTGAIGGFGFIFTSLRAGIRDNSTRIGGLEKRVGGLAVSLGRLDERTIRMEERTIRMEERAVRFEERVVRFEERAISEFGQINDVLARMEATQAEQGRQIEKLAGGDLP